MNSPCPLPTDRPVRIVTHSGSFHADELLAVATLQIFLDRSGLTYVVTRSRDDDVIKGVDIACDVGGILDAHQGRFDHHQRDGGGERNGIPYSSFGLIWKYFGLELCAGDAHAWQTIEQRIAYPVDAGDNGVNTYDPVLPGVQPLLFHHIVFAFHPTWKEKEAGISTDVQFAELLPLAKRFMERQLIVVRDDAEGARLVREVFDNAPDKQIVLMERDLPWEEEFTKHPEVIYVVSPQASTDDTARWRVKAVRNDVDSFALRRPFPEAWRGLMDEQLESVSGVPGAIFCHKNGLLVIAKTKEAALALARLALK